MAVLMVLFGTVAALAAVVVAGDVTTGGGIRRALRAPAPRSALDEAAESEIVGTTPTGARTSVPLTSRTSSTLLAFLGSTCVTCHDLWYDADRAARDGRRDCSLVIVTKGPAVESARIIATKAPRSVPVVMTDEPWHTYAIGAAPAFVLVDGRSGVAARLDAEPRWSSVLGAARDVRTTGNAS